jgi:hypothetical protein
MIIDFGINNNGESFRGKQALPVGRNQSHLQIRLPEADTAEAKGNNGCNKTSSKIRELMKNNAQELVN